MSASQLEALLEWGGLGRGEEKKFCRKAACSEHIGSLAAG